MIHSQVIFFTMNKQNEVIAVLRIVCMIKIEYVKHDFNSKFLTLTKLQYMFQLMNY